MGVFGKETELCEAFIETVPKDWQVYPETAGWDMLLVHKVTGYQIGVEAKLRLNAKVIRQAAEAVVHSRFDAQQGPDFRAVLVPEASGDMMAVCKLVGLTIITMRRRDRYVSYHDSQCSKTWQSQPALPKFTKADLKDIRAADIWLDSASWHDCAPLQKHNLPEYVPDVAAGASAPQTVGHWKIQAMKVCQVIEKHTFIHRSDFKALGISMSLWTSSGWLQRSDFRGWWVAGHNFPSGRFRAQHQKVWSDIEADQEKWMAKAKLRVDRPAGLPFDDRS
ncbi:hypothetical protein [Oceanicola sp. S124]|uniref:hypothetical protein n=1 Tax=Oceanicola sp. S124 TaxID=1042378 RepID=UPI000255A6B7|nr:hypothetical protein [Oceanicola sp. S124]